MSLMGAFVAHWSNKYFHVMASNGLLYHDCISNRIGSGIRNCAPNGRCEIERSSCWTIISSGDMLLALHRRATRSHRPSMAMPLAAAPYRASGLDRMSLSMW